MNTRQSNLKAIRPEILTATINEHMSNDERFQNLVLRPIIKMQNDLLIEVYKNYVNKYKSSFYDLPVEKKISYIENSIQRDIKFRNSLKGIIIGFFTVDEYLVYIKKYKVKNKKLI